MPKSESDKLTLAREIVAGRRNLSLKQLYDLATELLEDNQIGYARRLYSVALASTSPDLRNKIQIKLALSTYKDPDLPVDERLKKAETMLQDLLDRSTALT